jgi:hypothetical protein
MAALVALTASGCDGCSKSEPSGATSTSASAVASSASPLTPLPPDAAPINATPIPTASVAAMLNPDELPAYSGPTGSVEGTIYVTGDPAPDTPADFSKCPDAASMYGKAFREGEPQTPGGPRWLADAVVAVTGYSGFYVRERSEAAPISIKGCGFDRRTLTMTFGQRIEVTNESKEFWTPRLEPGSTNLMMMAPPGGEAVKIYPRTPGYYRLVDHDRHYAFVELYAFLHPLHTTSKASGTYRIDGVPVGKLKVNTSHPRINGETAVDVDVREGVVLRVDLTLHHVRPPDAGAPSKPSEPRTADAGARRR